MADVKDQIRKILSIAADDAASEQEVQNALAIAAQAHGPSPLIRRGLTDQPAGSGTGRTHSTKGEAEATRGQRENAEVGKGTGPNSGGDCRRGGLLLPRIAALTTAAGLSVRDGRGKQIKASAVVFYGIAEDVETAIRLWHELRLAISALARLRYGSVARGDGAAYAEGFVAGVEEKRLKRAADEKHQARLDGTDKRRKRG